MYISRRAIYRYYQGLAPFLSWHRCKAFIFITTSLLVIFKDFLRITSAHSLKKVSWVNLASMGVQNDTPRTDWVSLLFSLWRRVSWVNLIVVPRQESTLRSITPGERNVFPWFKLKLTDPTPEVNLITE